MRFGHVRGSMNKLRSLNVLKQVLLIIDPRLREIEAAHFGQESLWVGLANGVQLGAVIP